jgi:hypothetical protein
MMRDVSRAAAGSPQQLKRGHNKDFALTKIQLANLITVTTNLKTRAIIVLASRGYPVREIVEFRGAVMRYAPEQDARLQNLSEVESECLLSFPEGFEISTVAVWRRVKKALLKALDKGVVEFDPERVPFPEALRAPKEDPLIMERMQRFSQRIHTLAGGIFDKRDPLKDCPHIDCQEYRELLRILEMERKIL